MKFTTVFAVLATLATAFSAIFSDKLSTNAKRLASGLTPFPPVRRGNQTPTYGGKRSQPSGISNPCNTGSLQCCDALGNSDDAAVQLILTLLAITVPPSVPIGVTCSPLTTQGLNSNSCASQALCCENNNFNGIVAIGCSPAA